MNIRENGLSQLGERAAATARGAGLDSLLAAVVAACQCLLEHSDLRAGLQAAVAALGRLSGHDRAQVWELGDGPPSCVAAWDAPGMAPAAGMEDRVGTAGLPRWPGADWQAAWQPLRAGRATRSMTPEPDPDAPLDRPVDRRSELRVPVFVGDSCWGCIALVGGVDERHNEERPHQERHHDEAEVEVLRAAAAAVAAAVQRSRAEARQLAQAQAHAAQAAQAEALNLLTQGVVRATRDLLDHPDFSAGVSAWLAHLGRAAQADVAALIDVGGTSAASAAATAGIATWSHAWRRDGTHRPVPPVPSTIDFDDWTERLRAQQAVWASIDELVDPRSVQFWRDTDCATNLLMPVVLDGALCCVLCFDWREPRAYSAGDEAVLRTAAESFTAVLSRQRAVDDLLTERERRIAIERRRADEAAVLVARVERHAVLLQVVACATEILLAASTPEQGIEAVLARVGPVVGADRVCLARLEWTPDDDHLHGWLHVSHEWTRPGAQRRLAGGLQRCPMRRSDATWVRHFELLKAPGWVRQRVDELDEPYRSEQRELGVVWSLRYAVVVGGQLAALLCFDCAGPFDPFERATIDALQTVGSAIADALWRHQLQQQALAAERARADESERLARLLEQVVSSSRILIDADLQNFETALNAWLGGFGRAVDAIRCTFCDLVDFPATGTRTPRALAEWVREGVTGSPPVSFDSPLVIDPRGAEDLMARLAAGRAITLHTEDTADPMRAFLDGQGIGTVVLAPLVMDGAPWGCLSFDHAQRREPQPGEFAVLQTAADTLVAILKRNEALKRMLAEREARLGAEQRRSSELARVNDALRQALDALAGADGETAFLRDVLVQLQRQTGALAAYLFRSDDADGRLRLVGRAALGQFSHEPAADDPALFSRGFDMVPELRATLARRGRLLWRRVDPATPVDERTPESTRWHLRQGHRANAVHALTIGERLVGFIGMVFDHDEPLSDAQGALAHALCQPITLALELTRLARLAQRGSEQTAMLKERNRLAREIHDGIAQSFLAIQMQLDLLGARDAGPPPVQKALLLARHGLYEARRAVAALRPQGLQNSDLPGGIQQLLAQVDPGGELSSNFVGPQAWQPLPAEVEDHLFRIVQEAVNNALRHAQARHIKVELSQAAGEATVLVTDDGVGFDVERAMSRQGFGLESMQQRAQLIGARIDWLARPGQGTQVLVSWTSPGAAGDAPAAAPKAAE